MPFIGIAIPPPQSPIRKTSPSLTAAHSKWPLGSLLWVSFSHEDSYSASQDEYAGLEASVVSVRNQLRYLSAIISLLLATFVATTNAAEDAMTGVFSNEEEGFKIITVMIHKSGLGFLDVAGVSGGIGEWKFDKGNSVLSFKISDPSTQARSAPRLHVRFHNARFNVLHSKT